jgi:hypothetical protein
VARTHRDPELAVAASALAALAVAFALVTVRGEVHSEAIALVLAVTVAVAGRCGGRSGGIAAALTAATAFNFFHTQPYPSLKIDNADDVLTTVLLLVVGLVVGGLSSRVDDVRRAPDSAVTRVLTVAMEGDHADVESSVRAELLTVLDLRECWFETGQVDLPALASRGRIPDGGIAISVDAPGRHFGHLVCIPSPESGASVADRRAAVALAEVLGLTLGAAGRSGGAAWSPR